MPLDIAALDKPDARLIQAGLKEFGHYDGTTLGVPGPKTKAAYQRYRDASGDVPDPAQPAPDVTLTYRASVRAEYEFPGRVKLGARGRKARQVQEWVSIHGFRTAIDESYGPATKRAVALFQTARGLSATGSVDEATWDQLVAPLVRALAPVAAGADYAETVLRVAKQHLREHPIELGGQNKGPWVRTYMHGNQGRSWLWCAGFVTFVLDQAAQIHGSPSPIEGSFSCDSLAAQARNAGRFVPERDLDRGQASWSEAGLGMCSVFLSRRTSTDWTHTGFAFGYGSNGTFDTIEGNTNDEGSREGIEVCQRIRSRIRKDFIRLV